LAERQTHIVRISELQPDASDFRLPLLAELLDQEFVIHSVRFEQGGFGEFAVLTTNKGTFRTSSQVLLKQLHGIEDVLKDKIVQATLRKRKNYYTFE